MTIHPTELHSEFPTLANPFSITDTWTLTKLTRAFCRYLSDEFNSLTPDAKLKGREVHSFLTGPLSSPRAMESYIDRAHAVQAIDAFSKARRAP